MYRPLGLSFSGVEVRRRGSFSVGSPFGTCAFTPLASGCDSEANAYHAAQAPPSGTKKAQPRTSPPNRIKRDCAHLELQYVEVVAGAGFEPAAFGL